MGAETGGDTRCGIGTRLRSARERKGLTILQAAEKLHVDARIVESLESEDFAALGAPVYVRGHLRHYAELLGEPAAELQELYSSTIKTVPPDLTRIPKAESVEDSRRLVVPALVVLIGFAVAGTIWWFVTLSSEQPVGFQNVNPAQPAAVANASSSESSSSGEAVSSGSASAAGGSGRVAGKTGAQPVKAGALAGGDASSKQVVQRAKDAPAASGQAVARASSAAGTSPGGSAAPGLAAAGARPAELTLKFTADSWAEVYDASGERLFYDVGSADSVHTVMGTAPLHVVLGNAAGVDVAVNGRPAAINPMVRPDGSARFVVNAHGRAVRPKQTADGG